MRLVPYLQYNKQFIQFKPHISFNFVPTLGNPHMMLFLLKIFRSDKNIIALSTYIEIVMHIHIFLIFITFWMEMSSKCAN